MASHMVITYDYFLMAIYRPHAGKSRPPEWKCFKWTAGPTLYLVRTSFPPYTVPVIIEYDFVPSSKMFDIMILMY